MGRGKYLLLYKAWDFSYTDLQVVDICTESTILVVEGLYDLRKLYVTYLRADDSLKNCRIEEADRGEKALQILSGMTPVCILLDNHLPDMSGMEWLKRVQERENQQVPWPTIVLFDEFMECAGKQVLDLGASDYLFKANMVPFNLCYAVKEAIGRNRDLRKPSGLKVPRGDHLFWVCDNADEKNEAPRILVHRAPIIKETDRVIVLDRYYPIPELGYKKLVLKSKLPTPVAHDLYQAIMMYLINARQRETGLKNRMSRLADCMRQAEESLSMDNLLS